MTNDPEEEKQKRIQHIRNLYAFDLFSQHSFDESLRIFAELGTGENTLLSHYHKTLFTESFFIVISNVDIDCIT